ncbi:MAG: hypothetical protein ACRD2R_04325 [Terriglobales bacterium]
MGSIAQPLLGHLDAALTNYATGYRQNGLVSDIIAPRVPVDKVSGKYYQFDRSSQKQGNVRRAFGAGAERIRLKVSSDSYNCESNAQAVDLPDETRASDETGILDDQNLTATMLDRILLDKEIRLAALLADTAIVTGNETLAGADQWSDYGASKPGVVVESHKSAIRLSGQEATHMMVGEPVFLQLVNHPAIVDAFKFTSPGVIAEQQLAAFFKVANFLVARGVKVSDADVPSFIWGKHAWLLHVSPTPSRMDPSAAKTFVWAGAPGTIGGIGIVRGRKGDVTAKTDELGADFYYDQKVTFVDTIRLIKNAVA